MTRFASIAILAGLLAGPGRAWAQLPLELRGQRIVDIEIAGQSVGLIPVRVLGIPLGASVSRELLRSSLRRLAESGRWADAQIDLVAMAGGVRLVAHLRPHLTIRRIDVRGNEIASDAELRRALAVRAGASIKAGTVQGLVDAVGRFYRERGYAAAHTTVTVRDTDDPARKVLVVRVYEGEPTRIRAIEFTGEAPPTASQAMDALELDRGDVLDRRAVDRSTRQALERMRQRGWLQARLGDPVIVVDGTAATIRIESRPGPRYAIAIRAFEPLERGDVEEVLQLDHERLSRASIEAARERVVDLYQRHGFHHARARITREAGERPGHAVVVVTVAPGEQLNVTSITFPGARYHDAEFLRGQVVSYLQEELPGSSLLYPVDTEVVDALGFGGSRRWRREVPMPHVSDPRRIYHEATYVTALAHIQELLQVDGFLNARVGPARLRLLSSNRAVVEIPVMEGPRSLVYNTRASGNRAVTSRAILAAAELERGEPFGYLALEHARRRVVDLYRERGYLYARVEPEVLFSADRSRAVVELQIVEAFQVHVGRVLVRGADRTSESMIRARLALEPGDLFRPSLARESQERLLDLGIFSGVNIAPANPDLPARVKPLIVTVTERPSQMVGFGAGVSTGDGFRVNLEYGYRNLFGYAVSVSLNLHAALQLFFFEDEVERRIEGLCRSPLCQERVERTVTAGLSVPYLPGLPNTRLSLNLVHLRDNERTFALDKNGIGLTLTWRPSRRFNLSVSENLENNNVDLFVGDNLNDILRMNPDDRRLERLLRVPEGESTILATRASVNLDFRDSPFVPTRGVFASATAEYARTLSTQSQLMDVADPFESNFVKLALSTNGYVPISEHIVFAAQLRLGRVVHLDRGSKTYPNRSFFLGGIDSMRGYLEDALIPQDVADEIALRRLNASDFVGGGDAFVLFRGELRFPIIGVLHGGVFADVGNLWADANEVVSGFQLRPTAGLGLRVVTPVGPIALDYGFILIRREALQEPVGALHFSIGLF